MIREVYLHGALGRQYGRRYRLDVASPAEAVRALCTLRPGLREALREGYWRVVVGAPHVRNTIALAHVHMSVGAQAIHLVPATQPRGGDLLSIGEIVVGVALVVASYWTGGATLMPGLALVAGGIAGLITEAPQLEAGQQATDTATRPEDRPSFFFQGVTNNSVQGGPVPLVFGTHLTGSIVVGASIANQAIAV